jgi:tetratricopeptide (TPR) repeat protein
MAYNELLPPRELIPKAKAAAQQALALDATLATAHALLGDVMSVWEWDWEAGEEEFRHAIALNPGDALAHYLYATSNLGQRGAGGKLSRKCTVRLNWIRYHRP